VQRAFLHDVPEWQQFILTVSIGLCASIMGTYLTAPADRKVLENFYKKTRPFGLWGPFKNILSSEIYNAMLREHRNDLIALPFAIVWMCSMFLLPMQLMIKSFIPFGITLVIFLISCAGLYKFWYLNLDPPTEIIEETPIEPQVHEK
jgi:hypothetical protein